MRRRERLSAVCLLLAAWCSSVTARFQIEKGGLKLRFPEDARKKYAEGFDISLANFGAPMYGGELVARLIYVDKDYGKDFTCEHTPCKYACSAFKDATPPFDLNNDKEDYIMLVDRGPIEGGFTPCKFALKVWNAQQAGAKGVIVVNYEDRHTTMEAPNDEDKSLLYLQNITIPATFIPKTEGDILKDLLKPKGGENPVVVASLDWTNVLPRKETVEWEFWTNSNDQCGAVCDVQKQFIKEFIPAAREFESNDWTKFTPHYIVWICPSPYRNSQECRTQCIHHGRYCTPDPDGVLDRGYSGRDVVQENVRQLCVFNLSSEAGKPWIWWDYVTKFGDECKMKDNNYNEECAEKVFKELDGDKWSSIDKLRACIGDIDADVENPALEQEMRSQRGNRTVGEVYILPTVRINNGQYRGKLSYTEVLRAICSAYPKDNEPPPCLRVSEDECREGGVGADECAKRTDGKTVCKNTFSGYNCTCSSGFISQVDKKTGEEVCLDINECRSVDIKDLRKECQGPRSACKNVFGGYECIQDVKNACEATENGGCWKGDYKVGDQTKQYSACQDHFPEFKRQAAEGKDVKVETFQMSTCECPPCFEGDGVKGCKPKCDLQYCNAATGQCMAAPAGSGSVGVSSVGVAFIVLGIVAVGGLVSFAVYKFRIRNAMRAEIRAIMAQYMPLENQGENGMSPTENGDNQL